jgi:integrase|tara:strand:- start:8411 stop:9652 length:1242 start_codon:yes stop_codon:yes gene_type:complete
VNRNFISLNQLTKLTKPMASIRKDKRSKYWVAFFRDNLGKLKNRSTKIEHSPEPLPAEDSAMIRRRRTENERSARLLADEWEQALRGNRTEAQLRTVFEDITRAVQKKPMDFPKCGAFLEAWLDREAATLSEGTLKRYAGTVSAFLKSLNAEGRGDAMLADIRPDDVEDFKTRRLKAGLKAATVRADLKGLNVPFALAMRTGKIPSNPVAAVKQPDQVSEARKVFTSSEIDLLLTEALESEPEFATAIHLAAFAGLRLGDAVKLTWTAVDTVNKTLTLTPQKTARKGRELVLPLHPRLEAHLLALPLPSDGNAPICPSLCKCKPGGHSGLSRRFQAIMQRAGVEQKTTAAKGEGRTFNARTFHSLRHSFVSQLQAADVAPDLRMLLVGHSDARTHSNYTHTELETLRAAVAKL